MIKKLCTLIGGLVLIAAIAAGGYFLYTKFIKDKINPPDKVEFQIKYAYETTTGAQFDTVRYGFVKGYKGEAPQTVEIASSFDDNGNFRTVTGIKSRAFENAKNMKTVVIPSSVVYFGVRIFKGCDNLETIVLKMQQSSLFMAGFGGAFDDLDLSKITIRVSHEKVKEALLSAYKEANVVVDESLAE